MLKLFTFILAIFILSASSFFVPSQTNPASEKVELYFREQLTNTIKQLAEMDVIVNNSHSNAAYIDPFTRVRSAYKKMEFLIEYYYPYLARKINGAALPFADGENSLAVLPPHGLQVIEEMVFTPDKKDNKASLSKEIELLHKIFTGILHQEDPYYFQDKYIFDAITFEMYRLIALGITGYDSQVAFNSIPEAGAVIESLAEVLAIYLPYVNDAEFEKGLSDHLDAARAYLLQNTGFNSFSRLQFITDYANPLSTKILLLQKKLKLLLPEERRMLSPLAPQLFATAYFNPSGYSPNVEANATPDKILLGERLFYDNIISVNRNRSCATCHQPARGFTDGLPKSMSLDNKTPVLRNAPTLWNAAFQPKQFYDSRAVFMESQVFEVVHSSKEMGSSMELVLERIKHDSDYVGLFNRIYSYSGDPLSGGNVTNAIASYVRSLQSLNSRFDKFMNGNPAALSDNEKKGFNVYMGKGKCATCHFVPLFNGVAPPYFSEAESEVIGVPSTTDTIHPRLDADEGKFNLYPVAIFRHAFKIPTLRNIGLTAPYMHNGIYQTLEEVIEFYNKGGGAGLGIAPYNQTLPRDKLLLSAEEKIQLIAFLHSLTDTSGLHQHGK